MDDDLLKSLFLRARDQYESAMRWACIVVVVLLVFHLMIFGQFVRLGKQLARVQAERARLSSVEPLVANIKTNLDSFKESATKALGTRLDTMFTDLRNDFGALDRAIAQIGTPATSQVAPPTAERLLGEEPRSPMQTPLQRPSIGKLFELEDDMKEKVRSAKTSDEVRQTLRPIIEDRIIRPQFEQLNNYWRNEVLPKIKQQAETLRKALQKGQPLFPEGKALWDEIANSVEQTVNVANTLSFQPPVGLDWWSTISGKQATLSGLGQAVERRFRAIASAEAVKQLSDQVQATSAQQQKLQETLQKELMQIEEHFNKQQSKLASLGKPFEMLSLDINSVVSRFPLLLGILLAVIIIWPAYRLRQLASTIDLMAKRSEGIVPREWLLGQTWFSFGTPQGKDLERHRWLGIPPWKLGSLSSSLICWGWIGLAAWTLIGWGDVDLLWSAMFTAGGCVAVAVAQGYRWYVHHHVWDRFGINVVGKSGPQC